jgi:FlaG/FlaF family flagellin (archaellin)
MNRNFRNSRKAIAPAIAVALLLAITIALVAAVGYSVTNVTPTSTTAPQGTFDIDITKHAGTSMFTGAMTIKQISGDAIDTSKLKLKFTVNGETSTVLPNSNNTFYKAFGYPKNVTASFSPFNETAMTDGAARLWVCVQYNNDVTTSYQVNAWLNDTTSPRWVAATPTGNTATYWLPFREYTLPDPSSANYTAFSFISSTGLMRNFTGTMGYYDMALESNQAYVFKMFEYTIPWLYEPGTNPTEDTSLCFGAYSITPGNSMKAQGTSYDVPASDDIHVAFPSWDTVKTGDVVEVLIVYTDTDQVIWQGDVIVG